MLLRGLGPDRRDRQALELVMTVLRRSRLMLDEPHADPVARRDEPHDRCDRAMMAAQISDAVRQVLDAARLGSIGARGGCISGGPAWRRQASGRPEC